ncbi:MAG: gamma-glutamyl-gamma-aminobutyrate hydrolase family protein, partial [Deltaproteobacteria bacterium]|nr:gamma-glutamyl-gamma-aminobutyrate hydrolase family protein [Deltaproteobacteria bacterium]
MLIGITCDSETIIDRRGMPSPRYVSPQVYADAVRAAGGDPVLLPYLDRDRVSALLSRLDGIVIAGGDFDVPPEYYGEPSRAVRGVNAWRSAFERALCEGALARDLPLLGICGGMQLLNVATGGSLFQDLRERPGTHTHEQPHDKRKPQHVVEITPGTRLAAIYKRPSIDVNSTHHQVVRDLGRGVVAVAHAPDGVVEAIELPSQRFALGVQWHPEAMADRDQLAVYQ